MNLLNTKTIIIVFAITGVLISCKKKEETPKEEEATPVAAPCFNSQYNGTFIGTGFTPSTPYTSGTLTVSKTNCETAYLQLLAYPSPTSTPISINETASQLTLNSSGGFSGKLNNGNDITIVLGTNLDVKAVGSFTFNGTRKP